MVLKNFIGGIDMKKAQRKELMLKVLGKTKVQILKSESFVIKKLTVLKDPVVEIALVKHKGFYAIYTMRHDCIGATGVDAYFTDYEVSLKAFYLIAKELLNSDVNGSGYYKAVDKIKEMFKEYKV
jgi:hypothetical protein